MSTPDTTIVTSSGNVFADLGFDPEEAQHLVLRSELMRAIRKHIEDSGQTQQQAARLFGVTQPRLNMVVKGKINEFSLDALVSMLAKAGMRVEMKVKKAPARKREARQRVSASPPDELRHIRSA
jgi:predicted XRE-type DNA-binding protein